MVGEKSEMGTIGGKGKAGAEHVSERKEKEPEKECEEEEDEEQDEEEEDEEQYEEGDEEGDEEPYEEDDDEEPYEEQEDEEPYEEQEDDQSDSDDIRDPEQLFNKQSSGPRKRTLRNMDPENKHHALLLKLCFGDEFKNYQGEHTYQECATYIQRALDVRDPPYSAKKLNECIYRYRAKNGEASSVNGRNIYFINSKPCVLMWNYSKKTLIAMMHAKQ